MVDIAVGDAAGKCRVTELEADPAHRPDGGPDTTARVGQNLMIEGLEIEDYINNCIEVATAKFARGVRKGLEQFMYSTLQGDVDQKGFPAGYEQPQSDETSDAHVRSGKIGQIKGLRQTLPTVVRMAIHAPGGKMEIQVAKLDTGSRCNLISRKLASSLGLSIEDYPVSHRPTIRPLGHSFEVISRVTLDWHVSGRNVPYTTTLAVLDDIHCERLDFDILLGEDEISEVNFYRRNHDVFYVSVNF